MDLKNCSGCGKLFVYTCSNLCPACRKIEEEEFEKVKEYLIKNPKIGVFELADATEVDEGKIIRWIREGRIEGKTFTGISIPCERCGVSIPEGRYCVRCSSELAKGFTDVFKKEQKDDCEKSKVIFHTKSK